jgi:hypothetical protein
VHLSDHQRGMLALIVSDPPMPGPVRDHYIDSVEGTVPLAVVQEIGDSWRRFSIRRLCPLTWRLADQRGRLDGHFARLSRTRGLSPFLLVLARQFLEQLADGDDALDAAVARFEYAMLAAAERKGRLDEVIIDWPCDPEELLTHLVADEPIGEPQPGRYRTRAAAGVPSAFAIERLS